MQKSLKLIFIMLITITLLSFNLSQNLELEESRVALREKLKVLPENKIHSIFVSLENLSNKIKLTINQCASKNAITNFDNIVDEEFDKELMAKYLLHYFESIRKENYLFNFNSNAINKRFQFGFKRIVDSACIKYTNMQRNIRQT